MSDKSSSRGPLETVEAYLSAVMSRDFDELRRVFAPDATYESDVAGVLRGPEDIVEFYETRILRAGTRVSPSPQRPFIVDGNRVAFEIIEKREDNTLRVADFCTVEGGKIKRLAIYTSATV